VNEILRGIMENAEYNANISERDYTADGLLHCGGCNTPKQCRVSLLGAENTVFCLCKCRKEEQNAEKAERGRRDAAARTAGLRTQGIQDAQIRGWSFDGDDGSSPDIMEKAKRFLANWELMHRENAGLLLWGNVGTGKTFFAACIANALIDRDIPVLMTSFAKIINAMSGFAIDDKNGYIDEFNRYNLLIIDDLGAERQSDFAQEIVYNVIDCRYRNGQPLIITTNLTLDEIKNPPNMTHKRIYDRILEMCVPIQFTGESRRRTASQRKLHIARGILTDNGQAQGSGLL
jgi:DNA replication protein DnaC